MRLVDLGSDNEFYDIAFHHLVDDVLCRRRRILPVSVFQIRGDAGQRQDPLGDQSDSRNLSRRRKSFAEADHLQIDLRFRPQFAFDDIGGGSAADDDLVRTGFREGERGKLMIALLAERRSGQNAADARFAQIDHHAADIVDALVVAVDRERLIGNRLSNVFGGNIGLFPDQVLNELHASAPGPSELVFAAAETGLGDAVGAGDQPVAHFKTQFGKLHFAIRPPFGDQGLRGRWRNLQSSAQVDERRIAHFDDAGFPAHLHIEDRKSGIADLADFADGEGIHDRLRRLENIHVRADEFQRHRRGHVGQKMGFDSAAESVGENRDVAVFVFQSQPLEIVTACGLTVLGQLAALHFDEGGVVFHFGVFSLSFGSA